MARVLESPARDWGCGLEMVTSLACRRPSAPFLELRRKKINNTKGLFKEIQGVREMVQLVERLTCKHEDPSSIPQTSVKVLGIVACPGEPETQIPSTAGRLTYTVL